MKISIKAIDAGFDPRSINKTIILPPGTTEVEFDGPNGPEVASGERMRLNLERAGYVLTPEVKDITITRTGEPPLRFAGFEIGSGEVEVGTGRRVLVRIYKTKGGKYVASVDSITKWQGEHDTTSAKSFVTPEEVVEWLRSDNDGRLGRASQEACEEAAKNDEAFGKAFVEEVD